MRTKQHTPAWDRVAARTEITPSGCWEWRGSTIPGIGYGVLCFSREGKVFNLYAHRISFEHHKGPIPKGAQICHHCDNRRCVNPDHLYLGTAKTNAQDCVARRRKQDFRTHKLAGKLDAMETMLNSGASVKAVAQAFCVTCQTVYYHFPRGRGDLGG